MKAAIAVLVIVAFIFTVYKVWDYWDQVEQGKEQKAKESQAELASGDQLPGLPYQLEDELRKATEGGPKTLKAFIDRIKKSPKVSDPRLAWIELDYVKMVSLEDPVEAKRVFREVKARVTPDSPVYREIKRLEKTYD